MSSAQLHLAETIDTFYGASDKASDSAMAAHAYRRSVEELDAGIGRELVRGPFIRQPPSITRLPITMLTPFLFPPLLRQDAPYRTTILDPLGKMNLYFPTINEHISKRNKKVSVALVLVIWNPSRSHTSRRVAAALAPRLRRRTQQTPQVGRKAGRGRHKVTQGLSPSLDTSWTIIITHAHTRHT
jgi:hypothetical protein